MPIFETPDEQSHWQYVRFVHDQKKLPFYDAKFIEGNQPPLYYWFTAPFAKEGALPPVAFHMDSSGQLFPYYPPRLFLNSPDDLYRYWPVRAARLATVLLSLITVLFAYLAGLEATGRRSTALLAGGLTAFLPQFTFRGMSVSNDAMVTTACAIAVYLIVRIVQRGYNARLGVLTAVALALAFLSKISALFLPVPFALAVLTERRPWKHRIAGLSVLGITVVLIAPWMIRNILLYGDPVANSAMPAAVPELIHRKSITSPFFLHQFPAMLAKSFVGYFGWANIEMPGKVYLLFALLGAIGVAAAIRHFLKHREDRRLMLILATAPAIIFALTVQLNLTFDQPQGRYLYPALTAAAVLLAMGLEARPRWSYRCSVALVATLALLNIAVLGFSVVPAYWVFPQDMLLVDVQVPQTAKPHRIEPLEPGTPRAQTFVARHHGLAKVDVLLRSKQDGPGSVKVRLQAESSEKDIAFWTVPIPSNRGEFRAALRLPPIERSEGRGFRILLEADEPDRVSLPVAESGDLYFRALYEAPR